MTHFAMRLPVQIEVGAVRDLEFSTDIVTTDGGNEVRNARWSTPLRRYQLTVPTSKRDDAAYLQVINLYMVTLGGAHTFEFAEWVDETQGTIVKVRFDSKLSITGIDKYRDHIETFDLVEVRE